MQSSGIETLVEELCSRLKDLQSKQGEGSALTRQGMRSVAQEDAVAQERVGGLLGLTGARKTKAHLSVRCVSAGQHHAVSLAISGFWVNPEWSLT